MSIDPAAAPRLDDRVAVVTGAARGIGREIALAFAAAGAHVACLDLDEVGAAGVAQEVAAAGRRSVAIACDVSDADAVARAFEQVDAQLGTVGVLVNDAFYHGRGTPHELDPAEWARTFAVNAAGAFLCAREAGRRMIDAGAGGAVVNVSSISGSGALGRGNVAYSASKGALDALTRELAIEWAPFGIRVNAIKPAQTRTAALQALIDDPAFDSDTLMATFLRGIPMGRLPEPADVAAAALFLASPQARMITGALLPVDGGNLALNAGGTVPS